jgi:hypothetical protein
MTRCDIFVVTAESHGRREKIFKVEFLAERATLRERGEGLRAGSRKDGTRKIGNHWEKGRGMKKVGTAEDAAQKWDRRTENGWNANRH